MELSLEDRIRRVDKHLIGIWRFRERGKRRLWCATFQFGGYYYDIQGRRTLVSALNAVHRELCILKKKDVERA